MVRYLFLFWLGVFFFSSSSFAGLDTREWKQAAGGRLLWLLVSQMVVLPKW